MPRLTLALMLSLMSAPSFVTSSVAAETFYQWRDARGVVHLSNRSDRVPTTATRLEVQATTTEIVEHDVTAPASTVNVPTRRDAGCPPADASGVANAIVSRLAQTNRLAEVNTLIAAGSPVILGPHDDLALSDATPDWLSASTEPGAIAYPTGTACPERPPLHRYAVAPGRRASAGLCDDYQRAFAEVGVAASRDRVVERSLRTAAADFATLVDRDYFAGPREMGVRLAPWIVEAHLAQVAEVSAETTELVDELTVALEEVDRAARAEGCW